MEQSMVDITALLSQFSELVASQQENVWNIHDATATTKENMEQGQEELVDATARTKASRHWTATGITAMGLILLIFHWIRP
jgi:t-SNARE complex subunit (syntaxin)